MVKRGVIYDGFPSREELSACPGVPSQERLLEKGAVAIIECVQEIPCNPCEQACAKGAISVGKPITQLPQLDENTCNGCGICITSCPGLAIFTVDYQFSDSQALVAFPFEYTPLPEAGQMVQAVNRKGEVICQGKVIKVQQTKNADSTAVVSLAVPKEEAMEVRSMKRWNSDVK